MLEETLAICYRKLWLYVTGNPGYMLQETQSWSGLGLVKILSFYHKYNGYMLQETLAICYRKPWLNVTCNFGYMLQKTQSWSGLGLVKISSL